MIRDAPRGGRFGKALVAATIRPTSPAINVTSKATRPAADSRDPASVRIGIFQSKRKVRWNSACQSASRPDEQRAEHKHNPTTQPPTPRELGNEPKIIDSCVLLCSRSVYHNSTNCSGAGSAAPRSTKSFTVDDVDVSTYYSDIRYISQSEHTSVDVVVQCISKTEQSMW